MAKLYIFGIGGTGSRVLRSFTYLLASGVKMSGFSEVVPIIIDADNTSGDKTDAVDIMQNYMKLYNCTDHTGAAFEDGFFSTKMESCCDKDFTLKIPGATSKKFKEYMKFRDLQRPEDKAMVNMLFSEHNLEADMSVGFKGNPNIGSVVLNQFIGTADFKSFADSFQQGDAIFIISSIFGGTGASGFPLLLKNLRDNNVDRVANANIIYKSQIGAITVLPYFSLESIEGDGIGQIDSGTFIQKTRAALSYYKDNLHDLNHLYYIGDSSNPTYENHDGGSEQANTPHFVEFASALAIFHFAQQVAGMEPTDEHDCEFHEYAIREDSQEFNFSNLHDQSVMLVRKPMTKFLLMHNFMAQALSGSWGQTWATAHLPVFSPQNINEGGFYERLTTFTRGYKKWLQGMSDNKRAFTPFNLHTDSSNVFGLLSGVKAEKHIFSDGNYDRFNNSLNKTKKKQSTLGMKAIPACWLDLFARVTNDLVESELHVK